MKSTIRKKRVSKNSKLSWRKYSNIDDINEFLEKKLQDERIGDVSVVPNDKLFAVDNRADKTELLSTSIKLRGKEFLSKPLRSELALENQSNVQDPIKKRNHVRLQTERKHFKKKFAAKQKMSVDQVKTLLKNYKPRLVKKSKTLTVSSDIWNEEAPTRFQSQWLNSECQRHNLRNTGVINAVKTPKSTYHATSQLGAITLPHPGTSYNPSLEDHQQLYQEMLDQELKHIKIEDHLNRVTTDLFNMKTAEERDADILKELQPVDPDEKDYDNYSDDNELTSINAPILVKKKSEQLRKKKRQQNDIKQELLQKKIEKKKITDIHRLKSIQNDVERKTAAMEVQKLHKKIARELKKTQPRKLSKQKFKEEDVQLAMPHDISGNLRNIKVAGTSILAERFKSMQRRNILAPSIDVGLRRRREVKRFTRNSHKVLEESISMKNKKKSLKVLL